MPDRCADAIQRLIEDPLSEKILWKEYEAGDTIIVDVEKNEAGEDEIVFKKRTARDPGSTHRSSWPEPEPATASRKRPTE